MAREAGQSRPAIDRHGTRFGWRVFGRHLANFALVLCILAIAIGATFGIGPLEARAAGLLNQRPTRVEIDWPRMITADSAGATWLPRQFQEELLAIAGRQVAGDPDVLGRDPLKRISVALGNSGWFEGFPTVRREAGGIVRVSGRWRVPAAVVRSGGKDRLISWEAKPMPVAYEADRSGMKVIVGVSQAAQTEASGRPDYKKPWPGEQTQAALELLALVSKEAWADQVAGIDVSGYPARKELVLLTRYGTSIVWGGRPSKPRPGDTSTASKLGKIAMLNRDFHRIDGGMSAVDVWLMPDKPLEIDLTATANATKP